MMMKQTLMPQFHAARPNHRLIELVRNTQSHLKISLSESECTVVETETHNDKKLLQSDACFQRYQW